METHETAALILTACFDAEAAAFFQRLRDQHFPAHLNIVPAHLTLFHHLPGRERPAIAAELQRVGDEHGPMPFAAAALRSLGRGVAVDVEAPPLERLRRQLATQWQPWLTAQDRQRFRPHVTIQNKVGAVEARQLQAQLERAFVPLTGSIIGLELWHYRGGPWESAGRFDFGQARQPQDSVP